MMPISGGSAFSAQFAAVSATATTAPQGQQTGMVADVATVSSGASAPIAPIDYNSYRSTVSYNSRVRFLVMHYTAQNFRDSIQSLASEKSKVSAHYLVPDPTDPSYRDSGRTNVQVFNLVDESNRAWHAGNSAWADRTNLNDSSIGIEHVNLAASDSCSGDIHFPPYNPEQLEASRQLAQNILQRYPDITPTHVVGHSDIAVGRKSDPGPCFPWKAFHDSGIGAWYDEATKQKYVDLFNLQGLPSIGEVTQKFRVYGYDTSIAQGMPQAFSQLVRAFQLHFRPSNYDGNLDIDTAAALYALVEKYFPSPPGENGISRVNDGASSPEGVRSSQSPPIVGTGLPDSPSTDTLSTSRGGIGTQSTAEANHGESSSMVYAPRPTIDWTSFDPFTSPVSSEPLRPQPELVAQWMSTYRRDAADIESRADALRQQRPEFLRNYYHQRTTERDPIAAQELRQQAMDLAQEAYSLNQRMSSLRTALDRYPAGLERERDEAELSAQRMAQIASEGMRVHDSLRNPAEGRRIGDPQSPAPASN
ncbi:N-acetylmuramoyl-L-alanine amidase [Pandoraea horticolens]|uniref:N-acetylmuramoyl-L-alanine amidase n=2 Tax=Pandoraea horticolens TaxID=2508298 RepID=A0A5E4WHR2_9BURK|nr:N-acetylmuramoyl-L-alanine amidase [Pandoraea horticolens]